MTGYRYAHGAALELARWSFTHTSAHGVVGPTVEVAVPHSAMRAIDDVRAGGSALYAATVDLDDVTGAEALVFGGVGLDPVVRVNGTVCGTRSGIWGEFLVGMGSALRPGANTIEVSVSLPDYEEHSALHFRNALLGFVPDVAGPFAGIWQPVRIVDLATDLRNVVIDVPEPGAAHVRVRWTPTDLGGGTQVQLRVRPTESAQWQWSTAVSASAGVAELRCEGAEPWSPDRPARHLVEVVWGPGPGQSRSETLGFRDLRRDGDRIRFGGTPFYMRGILHWGYQPESGIPYLDAEAARAELELIRALGFNTVKLCLFVPPKHYFEIADELGIVLWQELPLWLPRDIAEVARRVDAEYPRILSEVRGHASVAIVSLGCELDGTVPDELLTRQYEAVRETIPDAVVVANSGSSVFGGGATAPSDVYDYHFYGDIQYLHELFARFAHAPRDPRPWIFGEFNDFDVWRTVAAPQGDGAELDWLATDFAVNPLRSVHRGFASDQPVYAQREIIDAEGYSSELEGLEELSLRQGHAARALVLEHTRSMPEIGGYVITVLRDTPITTAGVLAADGTPKWSPAEIATLHAPIVFGLSSPLRRRWVHGGDRLRTIDPYNLRSGEDHLLVVTAGNTTEIGGEGVLTARLVSQDHPEVRVDTRARMEPYRVGELGEIVLPVPAGIRSSQVASLNVSLSLAGRVVATGTWEVFLHPRPSLEAPVVVFDPHEEIMPLLDGASVVRVPSPGELATVLEPGRKLITAGYDAGIRRSIRERGVDAFVLASGQGFPLSRGPFWRENVKRVAPETWVGGAVPTEHLGTPGMAIASDRFVLRSDIRAIAPRFRPLLSRFDARTFVAAEYLFEWQEGGSTTTVSTLALGGGTGPQPRFAEDNVLGRRILDAWVSR